MQHAYIARDASRTPRVFMFTGRWVGASVPSRPVSPGRISLWSPPKVDRHLIGLALWSFSKYVCMVVCFLFFPHITVVLKQLSYFSQNLHGSPWSQSVAGPLDTTKKPCIQAKIWYSVVCTHPAGGTKRGHASSLASNQENMARYLCTTREENNRCRKIRHSPRQPARERSLVYGRPHVSGVVPKGNVLYPSVLMVCVRATPRAAQLPETTRSL